MSRFLAPRVVGAALLAVAVSVAAVGHVGGATTADASSNRSPRQDATSGASGAGAAAPTSVVAPPTTLGPVPEVPEAAGWGAGMIPAPGSLILDLETTPVAKGTGPLVALTFDDGPSKYTKSYMDILQREKVPATFFMLSENALDRPEDAKAVKAAGFHVAAHTKHHPDLATLSPAEAYDEINGSIDEINSVVGPGTVKCFRPPYGSYDDEVQHITAARGIGVVNWDIDTNDWKKPGSDLIRSRAANVGSASIVLMHDGGGNRDQTLAALPGIIADLKAKGARFTAIC